jgi:hypothetical protein
MTLYHYFGVVITCIREYIFQGLAKSHLNLPVASEDVKETLDADDCIMVCLKFFVDFYMLLSTPTIER